MKEALGSSGTSVLTRAAEKGSVRRLLAAAIVPSSLILVTLMMEALDFHETSVLSKV
jgi:hypothetical protein